MRWGCRKEKSFIGVFHDRSTPIVALLLRRFRVYVKNFVVRAYGSDATVKLASHISAFSFGYAQFIGWFCI
jgi:hypothetical protein